MADKTNQGPVERVADAVRDVIHCDGGTGEQAHHEASHSRYVEQVIRNARDQISEGRR